MLRVREIVTPVRVGMTLDSGYQTPPGIGTGAAYADGDQMGDAFRFPGVLRQETLAGQLYSATYLDMDDEGLQVDLHLFLWKPTYFLNDNGAYSPADTDLLGYVGTVNFTTFSNLGNNQMSVGSFNPIAVAKAPTTDLWGQVVTRGALNIAAGNLPMFRIVTLAD